MNVIESSLPVQAPVGRDRFAYGMTLALAAILVWMPVPLGSNRAWAWSILELAIGALTLVHLGYCSWRARPVVAHRWQWQLLLPMLGFIAFLGLQLGGWLPGIASVDPYQTRALLLKSMFFALFMLLLSQYCRSARLLRFLLAGVLLSGCLQACYGTVLNLLQLELSPVWGVPEGDRARGSFVYQNHFANYLALCLSLGIGWLLSEMSTSKRQFEVRGAFVAALNTLLSRKLILRLAIIVMIIGLILSRSRMGNAGFFAALALVSLLALFIYRDPPRWLKPLVISIFVLDLVIVGSLFGVEKVKQRIEDTSFAAETRDEVVIDSLPIIEDHWPAGTGGGSFYTVFPNYQPNVYTGFYDHAHNDYVQFAIEFGVPVTALLGLWVLYALYLACRAMATRQERLYRGIAFGCAMGIVHMLLHATVDFNLQSPANTLLFLTLLTCCYLVSYLPPSGSRRQPRAQG